VTETENSIDQEVKKIEKQVALAWSWAKRLGITVVVIAVGFLLLHVVLYYICEFSGRPVCDPTFAYLRLNEWGDYFAGFGATLAFIFVGTGLIVQMKELALQRLEMKEARLEQMKATKALAKSAENEATLALFQDIGQQLKLSPRVTLDATTFHSSSRQPTGNIGCTIHNDGEHSFDVENAWLKDDSPVENAQRYQCEKKFRLIPGSRETLVFILNIEDGPRVANDFTLDIEIFDEYPNDQMVTFEIKDGAVVSKNAGAQSWFKLSNERRDLRKKLQEKA